MKPQPATTTGVTTTMAPSPLISTYVTTPGGFDYRGGAATSEDLYKEKVATYVNQRTNQKLSKETLAIDFTRKTGNVFKNASAKLILDEADNRLKMPLMRQFGMLDVGQSSASAEEAKRGAAPRNAPVNVIEVFHEDDKVIRDLPSQNTDRDLINKLLESDSAFPVYDLRYLKDLITSF